MAVRVAGHEDRAIWDRYVESHVDATPYHLMGWCLAVKEAYDHEHFLLVSENDGRIDGVLPLVLLQVPLGRSSLCSLPYCDVGGCLADSPDIERDLTAHARKLSCDLSAALHIRVRLPQTQVAADDYVGKVSMLLDLPATSEELAAGFKSKLRSQIRKAEKNGLAFQMGTGASEINRFYRVLAENMRDLGSPVHAASWFEAVRKNFDGHVHIGIVSLEDEPVGAGIVLTVARVAAIPWASTLALYNHLAPNMLIYGNFLREMTDAGMQSFDFGRSTVGEGTFRFKKQWGARPIPLQWRDYASDGSVNVADGREGRTRRIAAAVWKKLPMPIANTMGPRIRKFVSL